MVCAVAWACPPPEPVAVDFAWAVLPFVVVAKESAFAAPAMPSVEPKLPLPPIAVAVAFAVPPSIAVGVEGSNPFARASFTNACFI